MDKKSGKVIYLKNYKRLKSMDNISNLDYIGILLNITFSYLLAIGLLYLFTYVNIININNITNVDKSKLLLGIVVELSFFIFSLFHLVKTIYIFKHNKIKIQFDYLNEYLIMNTCFIGLIILFTTVLNGIIILNKLILIFLLITLFIFNIFLLKRLSRNMTYV